MKRLEPIPLRPGADVEQETAAAILLRLAEMTGVPTVVWTREEAREALVEEYRAKGVEVNAAQLDDEAGELIVAYSDLLVSDAIERGFSTLRDGARRNIEGKEKSSDER